MAIVKSILMTEFYGLEPKAFVDKRTGKLGPARFNYSFKLPNGDKDSRGKVKLLEIEVVKACKKKWGAKFEDAMASKKFFNGLRSGDEFGINAAMVKRFKGSSFFKTKANADRRPEYAIKRDGRVIKITNIEEIKEHFYAGCICHCKINIFAYEQGGGIGYSFWQEGIFKVRDGERLAGGETAEQMFGSEDLLYEADDANDAEDEVPNEFDSEEELDEFD